MVSLLEIAPVQLNAGPLLMVGPSRTQSQPRTQQPTKGTQVAARFGPDPHAQPVVLNKQKIG